MSLKEQVDVAEQLFHKHPTLTLPHEVLELKKMFDLYEFPNPMKIKQLVSVNPTLAGELVALANDFSEKQPKPKKIQTIDAAIDFLGINNLKHYVFCIQIKKMLDVGPVKGLAYHSIVIAKIIVEIAKKRKTLPQGEAYLFGLVHDIGTFLFAEIDQIHPETFVGQLTNHYLLNENEYRKFGTTHSAIGYVAAIDWGINRDLCKAILLHHERDLARINDDTVRELTAILELAHSIALDLKKDISQTEAEVMYKDCIEVLNLSDQELRDIHKNVSRAL